MEEIGRLSWIHLQSQAPEGAKLGAEREKPIPLVAIERLLAHPVASQSERPGRLMVERDGEHSVAVRQDGFAPTLERFEEHFGVARCPQVAVPTESGSQLIVVVDLAVESDPRPAT